MENVYKPVDDKLAMPLENSTSGGCIESLISIPNYNSSSIFNENLVAVQMSRPGFSI